MLVIASNGRRLSGILIGFLIIFFGIIDINYFTHPTKRPFRDLANYVKRTQEGGDYLINWNSSAHHLWESKYYQIPAPIYVPEGSLPYYTGTAQMAYKDVIKSLPNTKRIGIITSGEVSEVEISKYTVQSEKDFGELKLLWYIKQ